MRTPGKRADGNGRSDADVEDRKNWQRAGEESSGEGAEERWCIGREGAEESARAEGKVIMQPGTRSRRRLMGKDTDVPLLGSNFYDCNRVWIEIYGEAVRVG